MTRRGGRDRVDVSAGQDTNRDGVPDTLLLPDQPDLVFAVDTDRDALADLILEIGPDAVVRRYPLVPGVTDPLADACYADDPDIDDDSGW